MKAAKSPRDRKPVQKHSNNTQIDANSPISSYWMNNTKQKSLSPDENDQSASNTVV
jgi:hypothetical protein